jgi:hypothetical protein
MGVFADEGSVGGVDAGAVPVEVFDEEWGRRGVVERITGAGGCL